MRWAAEVVGALFPDIIFVFKIRVVPMFALGARGMDEFAKKAKDLGLIISKEDAKAAEDLTDAIDTLTTVTKMIVFHIGGALAGAVKSVADKFTEAAKVISAWVKENRSIVMTVTKVVVGVFALGVSLVSLGLAIQVTCESGQHR